MSPVKRIILNTCASYGRTLFSMFLGLFSARWVLNGLGEIDYGLFGVVGGIVVFIGLLNNLLACSVGRYYAYAIGEVQGLEEAAAIEYLSKWFNSAFLIHLLLPIILIIIGYPIGVYAIEHWLNIPADRICASIWVFRMSLFLAFINMLSVPYLAMYQAKQLITELSLWSVITTLANFIISYYILYCSFDRFITYAILSVIAPSLVLVIQIYRARIQFPMCRIRKEYLFNIVQLKKIFSYAFWDFFGWVGSAVRDQGAVFVINRNFESALNSSYRLAQSIIGYTTSLSSAIIGAMLPAITTAVGRKEYDTAMDMALKTCKFGALMILIFALPIIIEIDEILRLWLVKPPEYTADFCRAILIASIVMKLGWGHHIAVCSVGRIALFQFILGIIGCTSLISLLGLIWLGYGPLSVGYSLIINFSFLTIARVIFARWLIKMSIKRWMSQVVFPIMLVAVVTGLFSYGFSRIFEQSLLRVCGTSLVTCTLFSLISWAFVFTSEERKYVQNAIINKLKFLSVK